MANELSMAIDGREWRAMLRATPADNAESEPAKAKAAKADAAAAKAEQARIDGALVERCREGDQAAYQTLVRRYQKKAFWIAYEMINDREEANDIVQEAFVRVFKSIDRFDTGKSFYTWLYRIVTNLCIDALRKGPKNKAVSLDDGIGDALPHGHSPRTSLEKRELGEQIRKILSVLPQKYRTMILLRDVEQHSCKDIAEIVGCSHANVRWRLHKARKLFKELWVRRFEGQDA